MSMTQTQPQPATNTRCKRILVIDDNPAIHEDIRKILSPSEHDTDMEEVKAALFGAQPSSVQRFSFEIDSALQGEEGLEKVKAAAAAGRPYSMAFVDVRMPPGWDGVETISRIWKEHSDLQVVICTAYSDYSWEEMIRTVGPSDSLLILKKPFDNIEVLQMAHALTEKWTLNNQVKTRLNDLDVLVAQRTAELEAANQQLKREIAERAQAEQALRLSEERFSKAFKASPIPLAILSLMEGKFIDVNTGFEKLLGAPLASLVGRTTSELNLWVDPNAEQAMLERLRTEMSLRNLSVQFHNQAGKAVDVLLSVEVFELNGAPYLLIIAQDITEQLKMESQLRHSQKMEAVGQLAAGVAHDFNNLLTIVTGNASLMLEDKAADSLDVKPLQSICAAADRATRLVRQLLTFSRKQISDIRPCQIGESLGTVVEMLPRAIGPQVAVRLETLPGLPQIEADAAMLENLVMNLAINSRDAMPEGGHLTIRAEAVTLDAATAARNPESRAGRFVKLSVTDTGCGIKPEALPHIFEPFFTTKPIGQGTGLGLATVYGIAKQHKGWVEVESELGRGTTFKVFFPAFEKPAEPATSTITKTASPAKAGNETIMVVEDEPDLRDLVVQLLQARGYKIVSAASGVQALEQWAKHKQNIQLVLTDMIMPDGLTGRKLAEQLLAESPHLPIIYTSGCSLGSAGVEMEEVDTEHFLAKPYRPAELFEIVQRNLDRYRGAVKKAA